MAQLTMLLQRPSHGDGGEPLVHTVPAGEQLPEPRFLALLVLAGGRALVSGSRARLWEQSSGRTPSTCASCGVAQPGPPPWSLAPGMQLCGNLASALTPSQDPTSLHSAPTVPWHRAPRGGLLSVLLAVTPASFPRPWGLCRDSPVPPGDLPHPPLRCAPQPWPLDSSVGFSGRGRGPWSLQSAASAAPGHGGWSSPAPSLLGAEFWEVLLRAHGWALSSLAGGQHTDGLTPLKRQMETGRRGQWETASHAGPWVLGRVYEPVARSCSKAGQAILPLQTRGSTQCKTTLKQPALWGAPALGHGQRSAWALHRLP